MRLSRPARLLAAWIASFAMVFGALAPVLAQAGYRLSGERIWQELCTTEGVRYVLTEVESELTGGGSRASAPCQFCSLFASCLPAPASKRVLPLVVGAPVFALSEQPLPRLDLPWPARCSRAPPAQV